MKVGIGEVIEPSIVRKKNLCSECGIYEEYLCQTPLYFKKKTWEALDICYTKNWFGGHPTYDKGIIISNRLYKVLVENKIKYVYFEPAYLVE
ncbi:MAG: hypothetical protein ABRQ25_17165 [Clostridiaceae bacterium]